MTMFHVLGAYTRAAHDPALSAEESGLGEHLEGVQNGFRTVAVPATPETGASVSTPLPRGTLQYLPLRPAKPHTPGIVLLLQPLEVTLPVPNGSPVALRVVAPLGQRQELCNREGYAL